MGIISFQNTTKQKLARNELVLCMAVNQMRTPDVALIAATCGFDAIFIDMEHGPTSLESASAVSVAALGYGITPIARIASHHAHGLGLEIDRFLVLRIAPHLFGQRLHIAVHLLPQLTHQLFQLGIRSVLRQGLHQRLLNTTQFTLGDRKSTVLKSECCVPEQRQNRIDGVLSRIVKQPGSGGCERQIHHRIMDECSGDRGNFTKVVHRAFAILRLVGEPFADFNDRAGDRVIEVAFRQNHLQRLAARFLTQRVLCNQLDYDRLAGPLMRRQVDDSRLAE